MLLSLYELSWKNYKYQQYLFKLLCAPASLKLFFSLQKKDSSWHEVFVHYNSNSARFEYILAKGSTFRNVLLQVNKTLFRFLY